MADEARSLKAYGELPENSAFPAVRTWTCLQTVGSTWSVPIEPDRPDAWLTHTADTCAVRVNETDTFGDDEERDEYFDFEDISEI